MSFSQEELRHVAKLAALEVTDEEIETLREDLASILEFVDKLSQVNTEGVPATSHVHGVVNAFRDDINKGSFSQDTALENAPDKCRDSFRVPRII